MKKKYIFGGILLFLIILVSIVVIYKIFNNKPTENDTVTFPNEQEGFTSDKCVEMGGRIVNTKGGSYSCPQKLFRIEGMRCDCVCCKE